MLLLVEYKNGETELVDVPEEKLRDMDWRTYVKENLKDVKEAYCNLRESLTGKKVGKH